MLATNADVITTAEPWVLLPFFYALRDDGIISEYSHHVLANGVNDFITELPNGRADYEESLREMMIGLYAKVARNDEKYFIDKTPRYHLIAEEILTTFPDAKVIVLWRNPLAIVASMIDTWGRGKWNVYKYKVDLFRGLENMVNVSEKFQGRVHTINYEALVNNHDAIIGKLNEYLELSGNGDNIPDFSQVTLRGRLGDPTGTKVYNKVESGSLGKWRTTLAGPIRKIWCRRYLLWIGKDRLESMGYDYAVLLKGLNDISPSYTGMIGDLFGMFLGNFHSLFEPYLLRKKWALLPRLKDINKYS